MIKNENKSTQKEDHKKRFEAVKKRMIENWKKEEESATKKATADKVEDEQTKDINSIPLYTKKELLTAFHDIIKENPLKFDQEYLNQLKLEIISLHKSSTSPGFINTNYKIHNFSYCETFEQSSSSNMLMAKEKALSIYYEIISGSDLFKKDPKTRRLIKQVKKKANTLVAKRLKKEKPFIYKLFFFIEYRPLGLCHAYWNETKRILKEEHGIDWKTPQDNLPDAKFD
jgi:hypothetical protein